MPFNESRDDVEMIVTGHVVILPAGTITNRGVEAVEQVVMIERTESVVVYGESFTRCHYAGGFVDTGQGESFRVLNFWA